MFERFRQILSGGTASDRLTPEAFRERRAADSTVIDVRTPAEYAGGHVADALNIDIQAPDFRQQVDRLDRDKTYYLYCRSGHRSGLAAQRMREMGFKDAHNVGGLEDLVRAGVEISR